MEATMIKVHYTVKQNVAHETGWSMEGWLYFNQGIDSLCAAELRAKAILSILEAETRINLIEEWRPKPLLI
jgi:hypothetical protein